MSANEALPYARWRHELNDALSRDASSEAIAVQDENNLEAASLASPGANQIQLEFSVDDSEGRNVGPKMLCL